MSELKDCVESIFEAKLAREPVYLPVGISAVFQNVVDISATTRKFRIEGSTQSKFRNPGLCALTEEFGVVSLVNAYMWASSNLELSGSASDDGLLMQDPFHRDPFEGVTLIQKSRDFRRKVPTDYAFADDVRKAVAQLDRANLSGEVCAVLDFMQSKDCLFSLEGPELGLNETIQTSMPDFSELVFGLMPDDRKLRKHWTSDINEVVIHSNRPDFIVHGRPTGHAGKNRLVGMLIEP